jgi:hypothetical protein
VSPFLGFRELELRSSYHNLVAVLNKVVDQVLQVQSHRTSFDQRDVIHAER